MRWPVGKDEADFKKNWYNAQGFGVKTSYGYHEGDDFNLKTGGDSDLGQPIYAIADGEVTSVHNHTTKPTFGNHVHIRHDGPWGSIYSHCAHCQSISVKVGDRVVEGQEVAKLGKSGTDFAHLHFAIKLQPTGIDGIAKTLDQLSMWTDPTAFIEQWKNTMPDTGTITIEKKTFEELVTKSSRFDQFKAAGFDNADDAMKVVDDLKKALQEERDTNATTAEKWKLEYIEFVRQVSDLLHSSQREVEMLDAIRRLVVDSDNLAQLQKKYDKETKAYHGQVANLEAEVERLKKMLDYEEVLSNAKLEELIKELIKRISKLIRRPNA